MDATRLIKRQHDELRRLFKQYEQAQDGSKGPLFSEIADRVAAHATVEEKIFYPSVYVGALKSGLQKAVEEHLAAKRVLADLLQLEADDESFDAKMKVLNEELEHHMQEEERQLFADVKDNFTNEELESIGLQMEALYEELEQSEPRNQVPSETSEAPPLQ